MEKLFTNLIWAIFVVTNASNAPLARKDGPTKPLNAEGFGR